MSLHALANHMATRGRGPDTMLVHMAPQEVAGLQSLALAHGGSLTINPDTGLPEAGFLKKLLPMLAGAALNYFLPGVGMAVGEALGGIGAAAGTGVTVGAVTGLATGDLSKGLQAGLGAYGGAGLGGALTGAGTGALSSEITAQVARDNAAQIASGELGEEAVGKMVSDKLGEASLGSKLGAGLGEITKDPSALGNFAANNFKYGLAAMAPTIADQGVSTVTKIPNNGLIRNFDYNPMTQRAKALNPVKVSDLGYADGGLTNLKRYADGGDLRDGSSQAAYNYLMGYTNSTTPNAPISTYTPQQIYMPNLANAQTTTSGGITDITTSPLDTTTTDTGGTTTTYNTDTNTDTNTEPDIPTDDTTDTGTDDDFKDDDTVIARDTYVPPTDTYKDDDTITARDADVPSTETNQPAETSQYTDARDTDVPSVNTEQPTVQETTDGGVTVTMPDYIAPDDTVIQQQESPVQNQPDGSATVTLPADNTSSQENTQTAVNPDTENSVEVGNAGGDYGSSGDFGGGGGGGGMLETAANNFGDSGGYDNYGESMFAANGGLMMPHYATGGLGSLGGYSDGGRLLRGPGDGVSDSIPATIGNKQPARLADGEFVVPARIVSELGNGSTEAGARKLYQMMDRIQAARSKTMGKGRVAKNSRADKHLPA